MTADTAGPGNADLVELYRLMSLSRTLERACCTRNPRWFPAEGEEATIVGAFYGLRPDDIVAPHYRGPFIVYLMRGASLARLAGQVLGRATGYARGRAVPFIGPVELNIVPWVAGDLGTSLGVATGAALAAWYDRQLADRRDTDDVTAAGISGGPALDRVVVVTFGDGTSNRGDFHENLNMAGLWKLPIVYICQNNSFAISLHHSTYLPHGASIAARAVGYGMPGVTVDGNDVLAVQHAVRVAIARARAGDGPTLIEATTYRMTGHWAGDSATYREAAEIEQWRVRDPLVRLEEQLYTGGVATPEATAAIRQQVERAVDKAMAEAEAAPMAGADDLGLEDVLVSR